MIPYGPAAGQIGHLSASKVRPPLSAVQSLGTGYTLCIANRRSRLNDDQGINNWVSMAEQREFLRITEVDATALPAGGIGAIRSGELDGILVHGVFEADTCAKIVAGLERNSPGFERTEFPGPFQSFFYGRNLNLNEPDLDAYFDAAQRFQGALSRFGDDVGIDLAGRVAALLCAMDCARPFEAAPGPDNNGHFFTTLRGHMTGGYIPAHFDNEQSMRPSYRHVASAIQGDILSFVVTLAEAEAGGMLEVFDLTEDEGGRRYLNDDARRAGRPDLASLRSQAIRVPAGSMIILQSGRRLHRVQPVEGARTRWTMCSFMALSRGGDRTYCWG
jgi:hypothetical protein